jgi:hypothetical protein
MAVNWFELAKKMAQAARAGVAFEGKRLQEILAESQRKQESQRSSSIQSMYMHMPIKNRALHTVKICS